MERKVVKRRFLSLMLALCMVMTMMPLPAYAENGTGDFIVTGGTLGTDYTYENNVLTIKKGTALTIKNSNPNVATTVDRITVDKNVSANITLAGVNIDLSSSEDGCAFLIAKDSSGTVNLTLADNTKNILKSGKKSAGLQKEGSTGRLVIGCEHSSESNHACTATCGKIEASSEAGAGIGSAYSDKNSEKVHIIQILGGTVIAKSQEGAGIGSGRSLNTSGNVDGIGILGGIVTAESSNGYGIGSGSSLESQGMTSEIGIVSNNTSLKASSLGVTPRNIKGNQIFLMTIHNPNNEPVKIDGVDWKVVNHKAADGKDCNLYAYVDVDVVENEDFEVKVGNNTFFKKLDDSTYTFVDTVGLFSSTGEFKNLYDTPQKVVNAAEPGDIVKLLSNVDINETIKVSKKLTIDLNGYVLKMNSEIYGGFASGSVIEVDDGGDLRIIDSNKTVPHYFNENSNGLWIWDSMASEAGANQKTVNGGVVTGGYIYNYNECGGGVFVSNDAKLTLDGGNIVGCIASRGGGVALETNYDLPDSASTFVMNSGSILGCYSPLWGGCIFADQKSKLIMNGGEIGYSRAMSGGCSFSGNSETVFTITAGTIHSCGHAKCNHAKEIDISNMGTIMYAHGGTIDANVFVGATSEKTVL